jgi:hypothetical protein
MSNSLTYNAVDLGGASYGFTIESNEFVNAIPNPRMNRQPLSSADGEASQGATFGARTGSVAGVITASTNAALQTQRDNIEAALAAGQEGPKVLSFDSVSGKQWDARILGVSFSEIGATALGMSIQFYAAQPWAVATSESDSGDLSVSSGGTTV